MKKILLAFGLVVLAVGCSPKEPYTKVAKAGADKTVCIKYTVKIDTTPVAGWIGSGVFISKRGHILTCEHVLPDAALYLNLAIAKWFGINASLHTTVTLNSGVEITSSTVVYADSKKDLGLLKVDYESEHYAIIAPLNSAELGQEVVAIGSPFDLRWSVTVGVISALSREVFNYRGLQTDAAINPGNSGGPLFNLDGELVGINSAGIPNSNNLGFAVNLDEIHEFLDMLRGL